MRKMIQWYFILVISPQNPTIDEYQVNCQKIAKSVRSLISTDDTVHHTVQLAKFTYEYYIVFLIRRRVPHQFQLRRKTRKLGFPFTRTWQQCIVAFEITVKSHVKVTMIRIVIRTVCYTTRWLRNVKRSQSSIWRVHDEASLM